MPSLPERLSDGSLPSYAWPGGYPLFYLTADNGILCPDCASGKNDSLAFVGKSDCPDDRQWRVIACDVHWEEDPLTCDHCDADIESAYGPMEGEDS